MLLPEADITYFARQGVAHSITVESGMTCVVLPKWPLPPGFDQNSADLLIRLSPGYPDIAPDMWWFFPAVHLSNGQELPQTNVFEGYLGRRWQRWSRHLGSGQWKSGVDGVESFLALIRQHLERSVPVAAQ